MSCNEPYDPFLQVDPEQVASLLISLFPKGEPRPPEQVAKNDEERRANQARYHEERYGPLSSGCYRLLEQGGIAGWHLELEIDGEEIVLRAPEAPLSEFAVFGDRQWAMQLAREEIARRHGRAAAEEATFKFVWGGRL